MDFEIGCQSGAAASSIRKSDVLATAELTWQGNAAVHLSGSRANTIRQAAIVVAMQARPTINAVAKRDIVFLAGYYFDDSYRTQDEPAMKANTWNSPAVKAIYREARLRLAPCRDMARRIKQGIGACGVEPICKVLPIMIC